MDEVPKKRRQGRQKGTAVTKGGETTPIFFRGDPGITAIKFIIELRKVRSKWIVFYMGKELPGKYSSRTAAFYAMNATYDQLIKMTRIVNDIEGRLITIDDLRIHGISKYWKKKRPAHRIALDERNEENDSEHVETK